MVSNKMVSKGDDMVSKIGGKDIWGIGKTCNKIFTNNTIKITITQLDKLKTDFNQLLANVLAHNEIPEIQQEFIKMWNNPIHRYSTGYLYFVLLFVAKYGSDKDCQARLRDFAVAFDIFIKQDIKDTKKKLDDLVEELKTQSTPPPNGAFGRKKVEDSILIAKKKIFNLNTVDYVDLKVDINEVIESIKFLYEDFKTCPIVKMFDGLVKIEKRKILFLTPTKDKTGKTNYIYDSATIKNDFVFVLDNLLKFLTVAKEVGQINNSSSSTVTKKDNIATNVVLYFFGGVYFIGATFVSAVVKTPGVAAALFS